MDCKDAYRYFDELNLEYKETGAQKRTFENEIYTSSIAATRENLLCQLLTAKEVLERKTRDPKDGMRCALHYYQTTEEQKQALELSALKQQILLRQRKNSTAIKVAILQKEASYTPLESNEIREMTKLLAALSLQIQQIEQQTLFKKKKLEMKQKSQMSALQDLGGVDLRFSNYNLLNDPYEFDTYDNSISYTCSMPALNQISSSSSSKIAYKDKIFAFFSGNSLSKTKKRFWSFHGLTKADNENPKNIHRPTSRSLYEQRTHGHSEQNLFFKVTPEIQQKMEISAAALYEIEEFKKLIAKYNERNGII